MKNQSIVSPAGLRAAANFQRGDIQLARHEAFVTRYSMFGDGAWVVGYYALEGCYSYFKRAADALEFIKHHNANRPQLLSHEDAPAFLAYADQVMAWDEPRDVRPHAIAFDAVSA